MLPFARPVLFLSKLPKTIPSVSESKRELRPLPSERSYHCCSKCCTHNYNSPDRTSFKKQLINMFIYGTTNENNIDLSTPSKIIGRRYK